MIKIENHITISKNNKEILQKNKDNQIINREKEGSDNVNNNNKTWREEDRMIQKRLASKLNWIHK